ncbi:transposase [Micromonospora zingiberis]|uniref:transposase n=1 Tax=Micromonospora zingiberis TaxID=2053011 RepID=UPI001F0DAAFB|nr:transposase [Micromonospora zingiberis]
MRTGHRSNVILDNLSAHKGRKIRTWAARNKVELCFTPTYASWANPIDAALGSPARHRPPGPGTPCSRSNRLKREYVGGR